MHSSLTIYYSALITLPLHVSTLLRYLQEARSQYLLSYVGT